MAEPAPFEERARSLRAHTEVVADRVAGDRSTKQLLDLLADGSDRELASSLVKHVDDGAGDLAVATSSIRPGTARSSPLPANFVIFVTYERLEMTSVEV